MVKSSLYQHLDVDWSAEMLLLFGGDHRDSRQVGSTYLSDSFLPVCNKPSFCAKYEVQWVLPSHGSIHNPQFTATCIHKYSQRESLLGLTLCVNMHQVLVYNSSLDKWRRLWVKLPDPGLAPGSTGVQVNISSILQDVVAIPKSDHNICGLLKTSKRGFQSKIQFRIDLCI